MISQSILNKVSDWLTERHGQSVLIEGVNEVGGGSINHTFQLKTNSGLYFLKWNDATLFPNMFESEAAGLSILRSTDTIEIPEVIFVNTDAVHSFLLMEWVEAGERRTDFFENFGVQLAHLHRITQTYFGLANNNYIGSLPQSNIPHHSWKDFFILERIEPQLRMAGSHFNAPFLKQFDNLFKKLPELFPDEKPALLHGDLWSGNYLTGKSGQACLIDPAVYYGHREMDIAMTTLFGGFDPRFYESYNRHFPLEKEWEQRLNICNLYPLLVHVNLFGGSYVQQVRSIVSKF